MLLPVEAISMGRPSGEEGVGPLCCCGVSCLDQSAREDKYHAKFVSFNWSVTA